MRRGWCFVRSNTKNAKSLLSLWLLQVAVLLRVPWEYCATTACAVASQPFVTVASEYLHSTLSGTVTCLHSRSEESGYVTIAISFYSPCRMLATHACKISCTRLHQADACTTNVQACENILKVCVQPFLSDWKLAQNQWSYLKNLWNQY